MTEPGGSRATAQKSIVIFGAGSVGRGFLGELFADLGWNITFADVDPELIDALNRSGSYKHITVGHYGSKEKTISRVSAIHTYDQASVARSIRQADVLATAVGANVLPRLAASMGPGLRARIEAHRPLDIFLCENLHLAARAMRTWLLAELTEIKPEKFDRMIGLVETSIGRMIPLPTPDLVRQDRTAIRVEPYKYLPYDQAACRGEKIESPHLIGIADTPFAYYGDRKLYIHNLGHSFGAYLGEMLGFTFIWEAVANAGIRYFVRNAMLEAAMALAGKYNQPLEPLTAHIDDLLFRFQNRQLADTVERVGRDPVRKLAPHDRFFGAWRLCQENGVPAPHLTLAVAMGLRKLWLSDGIAHDPEVTFRDFALSRFKANASADESIVLRFVFERQVNSLETGFKFEEQLDAIGLIYKIPRIL